MASSTTLAFLHRPKASAKGFFEPLPEAFMAANRGLSFSCRRIHRDTASKRMETRNGIRQP